MIIFMYLVDISVCGFNNAPTLNTMKICDCTSTLKSDDCTLQSDDTCIINFVVEPFMSMTYYNLSIYKQERQLVGYRAYFNKEGELKFYDSNLTIDKEVFINQPITTDGEFRPLITINSQMPGPTIIARENQTLHIIVYNELPNVEGISIHWHGMHQKKSPDMDGVAFITQYPILPYQSYTYKFKAFPSGTHWYHAHSGAHRTDGLYGALIVKDMIPDLYDMDLPQNHTLLLMDWQKEPSIDLFYQIRSSLSFWYGVNEKYIDTMGVDGTQIAPIPFWSGIINDKGRHFDRNGVPNNANLNTFTVQQGFRYRFRIIGAQALYAYKFSIEGHKLTVIATDGNRINSIANVDYVIVNTGERYDVVVNANQQVRKYWILAETLEVDNGSRVFNNPISHHRAEAILQYEGATLFNSSNSFIRYTWECTTFNKCHFVNCPYHPNSQADHECINVDQFSSPENEPIDNSIYNPDETLFYNFGFDGETSTRGSSVDGINFRFPTHLPRTKEFIDDNQMCPGRGCNRDGGIDHCACTQVIDINDVKEDQSVQLVITNRPTNNYNGNTESSHPVHLHGHTFHVIKLGYPQYNVDGTYSSPNQDVECIKHKGTGECDHFITVDRTSGGQTTRVQSVRWTKSTPPADIDYRNSSYAKKDTVIVPYGGYAVIRFIVDNPGWWFLHCHIEIHQLEGMSAVIKELQSGQGNKHMYKSA